MSTFKERLDAEVSDLAEKMDKLQFFIDGENFAKIDEIQQSLLRIQLNAMKTYHQCLKERIVLL